MLVGLGYLLATLRAGRRGDHQRRAFEQSRPPVCVRPRPLIGIAEVPDCGFLIAWEPTLAQDKKCHTCGVGALAGQGGHPHGADADFSPLRPWILTKRMVVLLSSGTTSGSTSLRDASRTSSAFSGTSPPIRSGKTSVPRRTLTVPRAVPAYLNVISLHQLIEVRAQRVCYVFHRPSSSKSSFDRRGRAENALRPRPLIRIQPNPDMVRVLPASVTARKRRDCRRRDRSDAASRWWPWPTPAPIPRTPPCRIAAIPAPDRRLSGWRLTRSE